MLAPVSRPGPRIARGPGVCAVIHGMRRADLRAILAVAVGGLFVLGAAGRPAAQPVVTVPNVAVPAATGDPDEPGTRSDSAPAEVRVTPLADTVVRGAGANYGGKKWLAIGSVESTVIGGSCYDPYAAISSSFDRGCTQAQYWPDNDGVRWSFLKFDTGAAAHVSSARLRLYGARSSTYDTDLWASVSYASDTSWNEKNLNGYLQPGDVLDRVKLAKDKTKRWYEWDVSKWVLQEKAAGRHVVTLVLGGDSLAFFHSRESKTNPPELVLVP